MFCEEPNLIQRDKTLCIQLCYLTTRVTGRVQTLLACRPWVCAVTEWMEDFFGKGKWLIPEIYLPRQRYLSSGCENWILSLNVLSLSVQSRQRVWGTERGFPSTKLFLREVCAETAEESWYRAPSFIPSLQCSRKVVLYNFSRK